MSGYKYLNANEHISRSLMISLIEGRLTNNERKYALDHMVRCELCRDAYSGLKLMPDPGALKSLNNKWNHISSKHKLKRIELNLHLFYIALTFGLVILIALIYLFFFNKPVAKIETSKSASTKSHVLQKKYPQQIESFIAINSNIDTVISPKTFEYRNSVINKPIVTKPTFEPVAIKDAANVSTSAKAEPIVKSYNGIKTIVIHEFLLIDYSNEYANHKDEWENLENGLSALYADKNTPNNSLSIEDASFNTTYQKVFDKSFYWLTVGRYDKTVSGFNLILEYFPNDLNAIFYKAFAMETNSRPDEALTYYLNVIDTKNAVFLDAAMYHAALCFIKTNNKSDAIKLLIQLVETKSFYAAQAQEKLALLK